jgi:hypothetical protein
MSDAIPSSKEQKNGRDTSTDWVKLLVVYFSVLIIFSLSYTVYVWRPTAQQGATNTTQFMFHPLSMMNKSQLTHEPNTAKSITVNSDGMTIRNTTYSIVNNLQKESIISSFIPSSLQREIRLVELAILFGVIGSSVHALTSLTMWHSRNKLQREFYSWYLTRPLIGAALSVTVYLL